MLIVFEGLDGSGKTTQAKRLYHWFKSKDMPVILTREPGGTEVGDKIRTLLLEDDSLNVRTRVLLFNAARVEHVENVIQPALKIGTVVICDRYVGSTFAYQQLTDDFETKMLVHKIVKYAIDDTWPFITFYLKTNDNVYLRHKNNSEKWNSVESGLSHTRIKMIQDNYWRYAVDMDWDVIDGNLPAATVHYHVVKTVIEKFKLKGCHNESFI